MKLEPGQKLQCIQDGITHLIVLLSSDPELGMYESLKDLWRCAQFVMLPDGSLCGAQIALYTEAELNRFTQTGKINEVSL